ncbi:pyridoxal-dependent decarboxylase domain-containing protein 1-like [Bombyx mori]|uniref:pyridoxal-dependent decarboxylase domain-containing protein 1-like n=1 Tax=Bombyx mori TaxID=7091 RepID=UPI002ED2BC46
MLRIEAAQADIERESLERLWQEGLLRRVPVVGRVVSWWAPSAAPPVGRRLHLASGTLQPTDDIYRLVQNKSKDSTEPARAHSPTRAAPQH